MKQNRLLITLCALSLPAIATSVVILNKNTSLDLVNKTNAFSYISSDYSGYRLLTSGYGIMDGVKIVISDDTHSVSKSSTNYSLEPYIKASEATIEGNKLTLGSDTAELNLKLGGNGYDISYVEESTEYKMSIQSSTSGSMKYNGTTSGTWAFNFIEEDNEFTLSATVSSKPYYVGYRLLGGSTYGYRAKNEEEPSTVSIYVDVQSVINAWATKYLNYPNEVEGQCVDLFDTAKEVLDDLGDMYKSCLALEKDNAVYLARYTNWAKVLGRSI